MLESTFVFLKGIGESTERQLWGHGIQNWQAFIQASSLPGISPARKHWYDQELLAAIDHLSQKNYRFFANCLKPKDHWRLFSLLRPRTIFLDIETNGHPMGTGLITLVGLYRNGTMTTLIAGDSLSEERLHHELQQADLLVTFFGTGFDIPFLRKSFPGLSLNHAHFDLCFAARRLGLWGGLKQIEQEIGVERPSGIKGLQGWDAVNLWHAWQQGNALAGKQLCAYNEADVRNLEPLADYIILQFQERYGPH